MKFANRVERSPRRAFERRSERFLIGGAEARADEKRKIREFARPLEQSERTSLHVTCGEPGWAEPLLVGVAEVRPNGQRDALVRPALRKCSILAPLERASHCHKRQKALPHASTLPLLPSGPGGVHASTSAEPHAPLSRRLLAHSAKEARRPREEMDAEKIATTPRRHEMRRDALSPPRGVVASWRRGVVAFSPRATHRRDAVLALELGVESSVSPPRLQQQRPPQGQGLPHPDGGLGRQVRPHHHAPLHGWRAHPQERQDELRRVPRQRADGRNRHAR